MYSPIPQPIATMGESYRLVPKKEEKMAGFFMSSRSCGVDLRKTVELEINLSIIIVLNNEDFLNKIQIEYLN